MPQYVIRHGVQFRQPDGSVKCAGQHIELDAEMAKVHAGKIDPVPVKPHDTVTALATASAPAPATR